MLESSQSYLKKYKEGLRLLFQTRYSQDNLGQQRGVPPFIMNQIGNLSPSDASIPLAYGGRGNNAAEILQILELTSYESLPLSLILGINGSLFLEPVAKYGEESMKQETLSRFIHQKTLGGLMITEPNYGTDALAMNTQWGSTDAGYAIEGEKHWAGLSGWADFCLMTAREKNDQGDLKRDIDFFVCDSSDPKQFVEPVEQYRNLGLYMIPYARNKVDIEVPKHHRLIPQKTGIRLMLDLLHRSRMRFSGMATGFIHRMLDEAVSHCKQRLVGGKALTAYDQVQKRLSDLQADFTISSAFSRHSALHSSIDLDLSGKSLEANIHKSVLSDMMQEASQSLLQLVGAKGYRLNHLAGRSVVDSRPFQIFEGSNDVIYQQVADQFLKFMKGEKITNFFEALKNHPLTQKAVKSLKSHTLFSLDTSISQRKKVTLGKIIGRITAMDFTLDLGNKGYDDQRITQAMDSMKERVLALLGSFHGPSHSSYLEQSPGTSLAWIDSM